MSRTISKNGHTFELQRRTRSEQVDKCDKTIGIATDTITDFARFALVEVDGQVSGLESCGRGLSEMLRWSLVAGRRSVEPRLLTEVLRMALLGPLEP